MSALLAYEFERLIAVVLLVKIAHCVPRGIVVIAIVFLGFGAGFRINLLFDEFFPRVREHCCFAEVGAAIRGS